MPISEAALEVAVDLAAWFARAGYPYPARPTLDLDGDFPLVVTWDDGRAVMLVIACTEDVLSVQDALTAAEAEAARRETGDGGTLGLALWHEVIHITEEAIVCSFPIRQFLGGE